MAIPTEKFHILNALVDALQRQGVNVDLDENTICIHRDQWDRYSKRVLSMLSACPALNYRSKGFFIFVTEQYSSSGELKKYSIKLCDDESKGIKSYDLDMKRGAHAHDYTKDGKKLDLHLPFTKKISKITGDILNKMRAY